MIRAVCFSAAEARSSPSGWEPGKPWKKNIVGASGALRPNTAYLITRPSANFVVSVSVSFIVSTFAMALAQFMGFLAKHAMFLISKLLWRCCAAGAGSALTGFSGRAVDLEKIPKDDCPCC